MKNFTLTGVGLLLLLFSSCSKKDSLMPNSPKQSKIKQVNWNLGDPLVNGVYVFKNGNGQCFQVGTSANGAPVQQNTYIGWNNQQWDVTSLGGGYYKIANHMSGKVLDVPSGSTAQNLQLQQWDYLNTDNQKWRIDFVYYGTYKLTNKGNGLSVTLNNNSTAQFEKISQTTYVADAAHVWVPTMVHLPRIGIYGNKFWGEGGAEFKVWGVNYNPLNSMLEDNWDNPAKMDSISQDFAEMKALGANVVRLHIQFNKFMTSATAPNATAINHLLSVVSHAETNKLYLIITGLGAYRATDQPAWYTNMTQSQRWATQGIFWEAIAGALANNPTIFGYDLINEPVVPQSTTSTWLPGPALAGLYFVQNLTRDGVPNWQPIMSSWITTMTTAIRAKDTMTPISVGCLSLIPFSTFTSQLDYASVHIYPVGGQEAASVTDITNWQSSKPLVVEETFPSLTNGMTAPNLQTFVMNNKALTSGWVSFYFGKTAQEYQAQPSMTLDEFNTMDWLNRYLFISGSMKTP